MRESGRDENKHEKGGGDGIKKTSQESRSRKNVGSKVPQSKCEGQGLHTRKRQGLPTRELRSRQKMRIQGTTRNRHRIKENPIEVGNKALQRAHGSENGGKIVPGSRHLEEKGGKCRMDLVFLYF